VRRWMNLAAVSLATAALLLAVTVNGNMHVLGTLTASSVDFGSAQATAPIQKGSSLPAVCAVGQAFFKTDTAPGQNLYLCTGANTWTPILAGGSGSTGIPDTRYVSGTMDFIGVPYNTNPWSEGGFMFSRTAGSTALNNPAPTGADALDASIAQLATTGTSGNEVRFSADLGQLSSPQYGLYSRTTAPWEIRVRFRLPDAGDAANSRLLLAFGSGSGDPPISTGVRYLAGTDTNLMLYVTGSANVWGTLVDTGVAPGTDWHVWKIRSDGSAAYRFYVSIDRGTEYSVCESGCTFNIGGSYFDPLLRGLQVSMKTNEAAVKKLQLDYVLFSLDRGLER